MYIFYYLIYINFEKLVLNISEVDYLSNSSNVW